jgi:hypothetical protein
MTPRSPDPLLSSRSDERLVSLVVPGTSRPSRRSWSAIAELYAQASRMRADGRADDVVQQTFLSALRRSAAAPIRAEAAQP